MHERKEGEEDMDNSNYSSPDKGMVQMYHEPLQQL